MQEGHSSYPPRAAPRVLLVDDDRPFLVTTEAILSATFDVTACQSAAEALAYDMDRFHVVCADYRMPEMDGLTFLARAARRNRALCCLLMTGTDDFYDSVKQAAERPPVIFKPVDPERLVHTINHLASIATMKRTAAGMVDAPPPSSRTSDLGGPFSPVRVKRG